VETFTGLTNRTAQIRMIYGALKKLAQEQGPGICLTQFKIQNHNEEDLEAMVFPFNALENPRLDIQSARWASILLAPDEVPFIRGNFPKAQWIRLQMQTDGGYPMEVGIIPINPKENTRLKKWIEANLWLQKGDWAYLNVSNPRSYQEALEYWLTPPAFLKEDKLLQNCYWERLSDFYYLRGFETHYNVQLDALKHAVADGYPVPHLYYDLGCLLLRGRNYSESRKALEKALHDDPNNPEIKNALGVLEEMEKQASPHP
jgi:tetratricopeptide (TPR) repeat protein